MRLNEIFTFSQLKRDIMKKEERKVKAVKDSDVVLLKLPLLGEYRCNNCAKTLKFRCKLLRKSRIETNKGKIRTDIKNNDIS